jgi:hypothetical protein
MRDDSSIDPAGTRQQPPAPYASGLTPPQAPQAATGPAVGEPVGEAADVPATQAPTGSTPASTAGGQGIWDAAKADAFRHRWHEVQTHFVEDPRGSVAEARQLVDEAMRSLADSVHEREEQLEQAGARASDSTEGMRDTVLQYHHLLDRLLTV